MIRKFYIPTAIILTILVSQAQCWSADAEKDRVQSLPGYMNFTGKF